MGLGLGFDEFRVLLIIVVCGVIGIVLAIMLDLAVTNDLLVLSADNLRRFSTIIVLMSLMLGVIVGVASSK